MQDAGLSLKGSSASPGIFQNDLLCLTVLLLPEPCRTWLRAPPDTTPAPTPRDLESPLHLIPTDSWQVDSDFSLILEAIPPGIVA